MINLLGFAASLAVLATFLMQTMRPLRFVAIGSNVLFIAYGFCAHLPPVLCLHIALLPINIARLSALRERPGDKFRLPGWPIARRTSEDV
jgi:hypothetical protein